MNQLGAVIVILGTLLQGYHFLSRDDIINEYTPILTEKSANFTLEYTAAVSERKIVEQVLKNDTWATVALMNTQIANIKNTIAVAKNESAGKQSVLACISIQETAAANLTPEAINATCYVGVTHPDLVVAEADLQTLAKIPNNTLTACGTLDPLSPSQDDLFLDCISKKILDLDKQLGLLHDNFEVAKTTAINETVQCITSQSAPIVQQINEINFQVTLCLALG